MPNPTNPFGRFILDRMRDKGIKRSRLITLMGYTNLNNGLRRFDAFINGKVETKEFLGKLASVLDVAPDEMNEQISKMNDHNRAEHEMKMRKEEAAFRPLLYVICAQNIHLPLFIDAICAGDRYVYYDKTILLMEYIDQLTFIRSEVIDHMVKNQGAIYGLGQIIGYAYRRFYVEKREDMLFFDRDGSLGEDPGKGYHVIQGRFSLTIGNKNILPLLKFPDGSANDDLIG